MAAETQVLAPRMAPEAEPQIFDVAEPTQHPVARAEDLQAAMAAVFPVLPVSIRVRVELKQPAELLGPPAIVLAAETTMAVLASAAPIPEDPEQEAAVDGMAAGPVVMKVPVAAAVM